MSVLNKSILGLFAVLCLLQSIEMTRMRREAEASNTTVAGESDSPASNGTEKSSDTDSEGDGTQKGKVAQIGNRFDSLNSKLKDVWDDNPLRDLLSHSTKLVSDSTKKISEVISSKKKE